MQNPDHPFPHPLLARLLSYCSVSLSGDCGRLFPPPAGGSGRRSLFPPPPPPAGGGGARDGGGGGPVELQIYIMTFIKINDDMHM